MSLEKNIFIMHYQLPYRCSIDAFFVHANSTFQPAVATTTFKLNLCSARIKQYLLSRLGCSFMRFAIDCSCFVLKVEMILILGKNYNEDLLLALLTLLDFLFKITQQTDLRLYPTRNPMLNAPTPNQKKV